MLPPAFRQECGFVVPMSLAILRTWMSTFECIHVVSGSWTLMSPCVIAIETTSNDALPITLPTHQHPIWQRFWYQRRRCEKTETKEVLHTGLKELTDRD